MSRGQQRPRDQLASGHDSMSRWGRLAAWTVAVTAFALAYGQFPLYEGNYNTYLLHGFAQAGRGKLEHDWLATTIDPFPVFSALITIPAKFDWRWFYCVGHGLLLGVYLHASVRLVDGVYGDNGPISTVTLVSLLALPQVWLGRDAISHVFNGDWGWCLQAGFATQYLLGHMLQPSLFGVLCVASLAAFVHRRDRFALVLAAAATLLHFSYLITALGLSAGYAFVRWRETRNVRAALRYSATGLALCAAASLPALRFLPTNEVMAAEAARILTEVRFPHHALPSRWLSHPCVFWVQGPLLLGGALVAWRTRIRWVFLMVLALGAVLLAAQVATGSRQLALLFPWRVSVVLVPVAFALVVGVLSRRLWTRPTSRYAIAFGTILGVCAAGYGYSHTRTQWRAYERDPIVPMLRAASAIATSETLFAIPSYMRRFRLETGAATFVDYKSHPYADVEVIEWLARLSLVDALDAGTHPQVCDAVRTLHDRYGVTHFVRPADRALPCPGLVAAFQDANFVIHHWP